MVGFFYLFLAVVAVKAEEIYLQCDDEITYTGIYCTVTNFVVTHSQEVLIKANYQYLAMSEKSIQYMKFYDSSILYIPQKVFQSFVHLKNLDVSYSNVIEIPRNTFDSAGSLVYLNVSHNNITEITTSVFVGAKNLVRIDLSFNQIRTLNEHAFKGLGSLEHLIVSNNKVKILHENLFTDNTFLKIIALDNNAIEKIVPNLFNKMTELRDIDLTNNRIKEINPKTFVNSVKVDSIILSGNQLTDFHLNMTYPIPTLYVDNNQLSSIVINATKYLKADNNNISSVIPVSTLSTERLFLSNNSITDIRNITNLTSLLHLDLSHNHIGNIKVTTFSKLTRLQTLKLRETNITGIDFGTFSKQTSLEVLDLSCNNLQHLNLDIFIPYLSKVREFYIDGNNLTEIRGRMSFSYAFPVLSTIGLSNNNFNCSYLQHILTSPYSSNFVKLHFDKDLSPPGTPHIRGIACRSDELLKGAIKSKVQDHTDTTTLILRLQHHEQELLHNLNLFKIFTGTICVLAALIIIYKIVKVTAQRRNISLVRSIAYRSSATVDTLDS